MSGRSPLDRAIDFAFGLPIAATAFAREATRFALRSVIATTDAGEPDVAVGEPPREVTTAEAPGGGSNDDPSGGTGALAIDTILVGYDSMGAREILALIENLDDGSLALVEDYEKRNRSRRTVLLRIAALRRPAPS